METIHDAKIKVTEHVSGTMELVSIVIGKHSIATVTHDKRMTPPYCVRFGGSYRLNGWKNPKWRFNTKQKAIGHVLDFAGVTP